MKKGWYLPVGARKAHYFASLYVQSHCNAHRFRPGDQFITDDDVKDGENFCVHCLRKRNKELNRRGAEV